MATRIKASASASASAVRRRIKRRSERASHKKKTNATLRSRKQRARKTARVMRGGGGKEYHYCIYMIEQPVEKKLDAYRDKFIDRPGVFQISESPILRLNFSKNGDSYTLTLEFMLDNLQSLLIPNIINGLLTTLFEYDLSGNTNVPPIDRWYGFDFNEIFEKIFKSQGLKYSDLATKDLANLREEHNQEYNTKCNPLFKKSIKKGSVFSQPCVIKIQFEPKVNPNGEKITCVRLMSYTTIVSKGHDRGLYYYGWGERADSKGLAVVCVNKEFKPQNGFSLNEKDKFYVFPSYQIYNNTTDNSDFIFNFDKDKITKQIDGIRTELKQEREKKQQEKQLEEEEKEKKRLEKEEEERKEAERRAGLTQEERDAEDEAKKAQDAQKIREEAEYQDRLTR